MLHSRTSQEVRGLKFYRTVVAGGGPLSHLARGAWIEMTLRRTALALPRSHLARGAWIEMFSGASKLLGIDQSHLARGAWIEINLTGRFAGWSRSHLARGAWIEMAADRDVPTYEYRRTSQEVRGLKFVCCRKEAVKNDVAPRKRCVD